MSFALLTAAIRHKSARAWTFALVVGLLLDACTSAFAATTAPITMPTGPATTVNGLALALDTNWAESFGYKPVRLEVVCAPPATSDRTLTVELSAGMGSFKSLVVSTTVEIPAGTTSVAHVISFPQYTPFYYLSLDVWEDGSHIDDLSFKNRYVNTNTLRFQSDTPTVLFVASNTLDVNQLDFAVGSNSNSWVAAGGTLVNNVAQAANFVFLPIGDLVDDWINYSSLDVIVISFTDVEMLATTQPRAWQALRQWTWTGGNLCVFGVGADWSGLAKLEERLECPSTPSVPTVLTRGWQLPSPDLFDKQMRLQGGSHIVTDPDIVAEPEPEPGQAPNRRKKKTKPATAPTRPTFVQMPVHFGQVVALASSSPFPGKRAEWRWVFNTIGPARWKWQFRNGHSPGRDNPGFDDFLIADIGLPPVKTYRVLITLFVVAIGPLNYWLLLRRRRLHLLLFTVPAAALLISAGLIGFMLITDGLESRIRARSYTELNQRNHEAASWARLSYYTGLAPSRGLLFPNDTTLYPLEKDADPNGWSRRTRYLAWTPEQHLQRGWLASRTPTQYFTVRACKTASELRIAEKVVENNAAHCAVENRLGTDIMALVLCDSAGNCHYGHDIAERRKASLDVLDSDDAKTAAFDNLRRIMHKNEPHQPVQAPSSTTRFFFGMRMRNQTSGNGEATPSHSLLEGGLRQASSSLNGKTMTPRTYLAVVGRPPEVNYGMDGLIESQSTHVIWGTW